MKNCLNDIDELAEIKFLSSFILFFVIFLSSSLFLGWFIIQSKINNVEGLPASSFYVIMFSMIYTLYRLYKNIIKYYKTINENNILRSNNGQDNSSKEIN